MPVHVAGRPVELEPGTQLYASVAPDPEHAPRAHWFWLLTHCPLGHWLSAVQRHPVCAALQTPPFEHCQPLVPVHAVD